MPKKVKEAYDKMHEYFKEKPKWRKARKKPIVIEFREVEPIIHFSGSTHIFNPKMGENVKTREGELIAIAGEDYIIRGIEGELYPIKIKIFEKTYDVIDKGEEKKRREKKSHITGNMEK